MDQSNQWLIINQANKVSSISDMHSYTPEQVNHSVADLQVLSTNCTKIWDWLHVMQMVVSKTKTPKTKTSKMKTSKMKTYSKTKTHAITQLMGKVLKRLDNLRENRESVKQSSIRWVFLITGN